ncbi:MAG: MOSC domain-containing protein [Pseudonocardiales bacterium]|nr:MOSC domain-containing protein [Actinomycetota bacterium]
MVTPPGRLESVNLAHVIRTTWERDAGHTGIDKRSVDGPVRTGDDALVGDTICDRKHHGGPDQAVYAYAREDAAWWAQRLDRDIAPGAFGENFSTSGLDVTNAVIGERWAVGSAVFEVSVPRIPCRTFAGFWDMPTLIKQFTAAGRPGAYLRIWQAGEVRAGDAITVEHRPAHGVSIAQTFRALTGDHSLAARLLTAPELPRQVHELARRWLAPVR